MARFLIDAQLSPGLCHILRGAGHEAVHVQDLGKDMSDLEIVAAAERMDCIIVSKDLDFFQFVQLGKMSCPLLWIRLGNTTNAALSKTLLPRLPLILDEFRQGEQVVELIER
jgi:predicted nuclease of predicted toxin-antitoxin system